eukprot:COSAG03_NODE_6232_length_1093_cov_2.286720_1_plen_276_part_10
MRQLLEPTASGPRALSHNPAAPPRGLPPRGRPAISEEGRSHGVAASFSRYVVRQLAGYAAQHHPPYSCRRSSHSVRPLAASCISFLAAARSHPDRKRERDRQTETRDAVARLRSQELQSHTRPSRRINFVMRASTDAKLSSKRPDGRQSRESRELCTLKPGAARRAFLTPLDPSGPYEMHYTIELSDATLVATIVVAPNDAGRTVEVEILDEELVIADEGRCYRVLLSGAIAAAAEDRDRNFDHLGCLVDWAAPTLQEHPERVADLTADTSTRSDP